MNRPLEISDFSFMPLDKMLVKRRKERFERRVAWLGIIIGAGICALFFAGYQAWASPIDKLVGVEGDAVRGNEYYCAHLAEYRVSEEDRGAITEYCNSL